MLCPPSSTLFPYTTLFRSIVGRKNMSMRGSSVGRSRSMASRHTSLGLKRSEEHTSELQSRLHLVCRLLLEKKKIITLLPSKNDCYWNPCFIPFLKGRCTLR